MKKSRRTLKAISLFSGVGGLDFGFEAAGYETRVALDFDHVACETQRLNRDWPVIESGIENVSSAAILDTANLRKGQADILIGGPPCQPFSKSGYWASGDSLRLHDPRANTIAHYIRVLEDTLPEAFLFENVPGLAFTGKAEALDLIRHGVERINSTSGTKYEFTFKVLNAADYGVPQNRERVFIIGSREGKKFEFPTPTHGEAEGLLPRRTAWDAFADLPTPGNLAELAVKGKWADLLPTIPEGHNYLWHTERGGGLPLFGWRRRYWNFLLKLAKDRPAWTVQAQPGPATGPFHWHNRKLSALELCRLQTFPDFLKFECKHGDVQRLVGNAVPSALAEKLANEIRGQFFNQAMQAPTLIPCAKQPVPIPERPSLVPPKFLHLAGSDTQHPGTGGGRAASMRFSGQA